MEPYQLALQGWGSFVFAYILHMESLADQKQLYFLQQRSYYIQTLSQDYVRSYISSGATSKKD